MKIEQCIVCKMVDETFEVIGRKQFEYRKSRVTEIIEFVDNYTVALGMAARLNKKSAMKKGKFF